MQDRADLYGVAQVDYDNVLQIGGVGQRFDVGGPARAHPVEATPQRTGLARNDRWWSGDAGDKGGADGAHPTEDAVISLARCGVA